MTTSSARASRLILALLLTLGIGGCEIIGGIFKAGFWTAIIVVVLVVVLVGWIVRSAGRRNPPGP